MNGHRKLLAAVCCLLTVPVQADEWQSTSGSHFTFETDFEGVQTPGEFTRFEVTLISDTASPAEGQLRVSVNLRAADMGDPEMNDVLFDAAWFDTRHYAKAVFSSTAISKRSPGEFYARGILDLKGTRKTIDVPFSWTVSGDTASLKGKLLLNRNDFHIGSGKWASDEAIGLNVKLKFRVQLERKH